MIVRLRHVVACEHDQPIAQAAHLLRLRPRGLACQRVLRFALTADPRPSKQRDGVDHFGNPVAWMFQDAPHGRFEVASEALIELLPRSAAGVTPPWEQVADAARNKAWAWREAEFAFPSPLAPTLPEVRAFAAPSFLPGRPIAEAASCLARRIGREFRHHPQAMAPAKLARVLEERVGSSQDLAHVVIAGLRGLGLPARSATGYVLTKLPPTARLHAWMGCWLGPGLGWLDLDPAGGAVDEERICLGWGRDHGDCGVMRSVMPGNGPHSIQASISLERVEAEAWE